MAYLKNNRYLREDTPMKILVVDDESVSSALLKRILQRFGACETAGSAAEAYEKFMQAHGEITPYFMITIDLGLPDMAGVELVSKIRKWEDAYRVHRDERSAKILVVSGERGSQQVMTAFRNGAEGYLMKPVTEREVEDKLKKFGFTRRKAS